MDDKNTFADERQVLGHVIAPEGKEATLEGFYFWARPESWVEKTQVVSVECAYPNGKTARFYGVVDEAAFVENNASVHHDRLRREEPGALGGPVDEEGTSYYKVNLLAVDPDVYIPPVAGAPVYLATVTEAAYAYGFDKIKQSAPIGLLKNGANSHAGPALIDLGFLLGENGAHLNINGVSGVATKTSAMLVAMMSILQTAEKMRRENPGAPDNLKAIPVLFSVKGSDMLWIDKPSRPFSEKPERVEHWHAMGLEPRPFRNVAFLVPAQEGRPRQPKDVVARADLKAYSWGLADIIERGLLRYLFAAEDRDNQNFAFLLGQWEKRLTMWRNGQRALRPREHGLNYNDDGGTPQTFAELVAFIEQDLNNRDTKENETSSRMNHAHIATVQAFYRRMMKLQYENGGVLAWEEPHGQPPAVGQDGNAETYVIDVASLAASPDMQRFVISAVLDGLKEERMSPDAAHGVRYLVGLDELNRWAPNNSHDATTKLFEKIAGEMRSLGVILFGAQQFASKISLMVRENASCLMIGRTGPGELTNDLYRDLTAADKKMITRLGPGEQLLMVPSFRVPAHVRVPFPAWAMRFEEVLSSGEGRIENGGEKDHGPMFAMSGAGLDLLDI